MLLTTIRIHMSLSWKTVKLHLYQQLMKMYFIPERQCQLLLGIQGKTESQP
jgi:hypothetical protein